jgi:hypothetical protein
MSKLLNKKSVIIISLVLLLLVSVGATVAYITASTQQVENEFEPVFVSCEVTESFDGVTKSNVAVKNTGGATAYVRAMIVVNWVSSENGNIYSDMPVADADYTVSFASSDWLLGADGFYYYTKPVAPSASTAELISSLTEKSDAPAGYQLSVKILASALQSEPKEAVESLWSVEVGDDKSLTVK